MLDWTNGTAILHDVLCEAHEPHRAEETLRSLRRISNVIQALENLIVQCGEGEEFAELRRTSQCQLRAMELQLRRQIHAA